MFHLSTLKTKTFWTGLAAVAAGGYLCYTGNVPQGLPMIATGSVAITGRDAISKLIAAYQGK
jgi:hypothetical protein